MAPVEPAPTAVEAARSELVIMDMQRDVLETAE